jgi:hypothetical protein
MKLWSDETGNVFLKVYEFQPFTSFKSDVQMKLWNDETDNVFLKVYVLQSFTCFRGKNVSMKL